MGRNERHRGHNTTWNNANNQKKHNQNQKDSVSRGRDQKRAARHLPVHTISQKEIAENEQAIREYKARNPVCELCNQPILEMASAMANRGSGNPVHFDCIVKKLSEHEHLGDKDRMTYIGNGKFAVLHFENPHDMRHFAIIKEIEWENRDAERSVWRDEMASLYSQVK